MKSIDQKDLVRIIAVQSPDAIIFANTEGIIEFWNNAAVAIFGFTADEANGKSLDLIVPERLREAHWRGFHRAIREGQTKYNRGSLTTRSLHKVRDPFYVDMAFEILKNDVGIVIGAMATARDITEKYLAQREINKRLQKVEQQT